MDWLILISAASLGIVVGYMVGHTFIRLKRIDAKALGSIISVMVGAGVLALFQRLGGRGEGLPREVYAYPVGLLIGTALASAYAQVTARAESKHRQRAEEAERKRREDAELRARMIAEQQQRRLNEKQLIISTIEHRGDGDFTMMRSDTLRSLCGRPEWTDQYLNDLILSFPEELGPATLYAGQPGIRILKRSRA